MTPLLRSWYRVDFPVSECCRHGKADLMQKAFEVMFITGRRPSGAALFESHDEKLETNSFYFSPEAVDLVHTLLEPVDAIPCEAPVVTERLVFLVGDQEVQKALRRRLPPLQSRV
jgi:hypothetical protein